MLAIAPMVQAQRTQPEFAEVYCPEVPASVNLCGKTINLDRSDMYERFDRELSSIVYTHGTTMLIIKRANQYFPNYQRYCEPTEYPTTYSTLPA